MTVIDRRESLRESLVSIRQFTREAYAHLSDDAMVFPQRPELNLPLWELSHVAWFQEYWCLRFPRASQTPSRAKHADARYDSTRISHSARWQLDYPSLEAVYAYLDETLHDTLTALAKVPAAQLYFFELALWHEAMHFEALLMSLHTLGLAAPSHFTAAVSSNGVGQDVALAGGAFTRGSSPSETTRFVFDNEKWATEVVVAPFAMRSTLTTCGEYARYLDTCGANPPRDWRKGDRGWQVRRFNAWAPMDADAPVINVSAQEAEHYCAWAHRRLPTEAEWEFALLAAPEKFPDAFGSAWQWTASVFAAYPGFAPDPYAEYSAPWFDGQHRVLRGSAFASTPGMSHAKFRNFYLPNRQDIFAGFRTCACTHREARSCLNTELLGSVVSI